MEVKQSASHLEMTSNFGQRKIIQKSHQRTPLQRAGQILQRFDS